MRRKVLRVLRDRPILSIILCVVLSEIIQFVIAHFSSKPPSFHYGIAVVALLMLFLIPVILEIQENRKQKSEMDKSYNPEKSDTDESHASESQPTDSEE